MCVKGGEDMARIKIQNLEHSKELSREAMRGVFGGVKEQGGIGGLLSKGADMLGGAIGGDAGGALQAAGQGDWMGAISGGAKALFGGGGGEG
jgi:hypothetical protein